MQIIVTSFLDDLASLQERSTALINLYEHKETSFINTFKIWLEDCESLLDKYKRPEKSIIAGIRALVLSASNGVYEKNAFIFPNIGGNKKILHAVAAIYFNNAQLVLGKLISTFIVYKEEAEKYIRQIIQISLHKGTFYSNWQSEFDVSERLYRLWLSFVADNDTVNGTRQVLSSVNLADALRIIDEIIEEWSL
jgi:hypothetical protein